MCNILGISHSLGLRMCCLSILVECSELNGVPHFNSPCQCLSQFSSSFDSHMYWSLCCYNLHSNSSYKKSPKAHQGFLLYLRQCPMSSDLCQLTKLNGGCLSNVLPTMKLFLGWSVTTSDAHNKMKCTWSFLHLWTAHSAVCQSLTFDSPMQRH